MKAMRERFVVFLGSLVLLGCASSGGVDSSSTGGSPSPGTTGGADPYAYQGGPLPGGQTGSVGAGAAGGSGAGQIIYFEFDSAEIRPEARPVVEAHARYLIENPTTTISLEGHADERGTPEYNIGLGERRGEAVRRLMSAYGVGSQQVRVVSYGEERPAVAGHDEYTYARNRRVEIVYY